MRATVHCALDNPRVFPVTTTKTKANYIFFLAKCNMQIVPPCCENAHMQSVQQQTDTATELGKNAKLTWL